LADALYRTQKLELFGSSNLSQISKPGESERDFRIRLQQTAREERDNRVEKLRQQYAPKLAALQDKIRRAQQAVEREAQQAQAQKIQTAISFGSTLLGAFLGRKAISASTLGRATTAARGMSRSMKESQDVARAGETVDALQQQFADLEAQLQRETTEMESKVDPMKETLETVVVKPKKTNISVSLVALSWAPYWQDSNGQLISAWK
jgi:phage host-nuclease inhibitor protein Gam